MTMTKVDPECGRYPQSGRKPYFDSALVSSLCCSESHGRAVKFGILEFCSSSFGDLSSEILHKNVTGKCRNSSATVWYILMHCWTSGLSIGTTFHVF